MSNGARLNSPSSLLDAVAERLGGEPTDSIVAIGFRDHRSVVASRGKLPPAHPATLERTAEVYPAQMLECGATAIAVLGYGPAARVDPAIATLRRAATANGLRVIGSAR